MINNIGTRDIPEWSAIRVVLKTTSNKKIKGSNAYLADINGNGLLDITCGEEYGGGVYYLNTSADQALQFADSQVLFQPTPWDERNTYVGKTGGIPDEVTQRCHAALPSRRR